MVFRVLFLSRNALGFDLLGANVPAGKKKEYGDD